LRILFVSDLGLASLAGHIPSGPQRFARAFAGAMAGRVSLTVVNLSEGNKLSRSLACLGRYDIHHVSGVSFLEPVLAALWGRGKLIYTAHGTLAREAAVGYRYPKRMLRAEGLLLKNSAVIACVSGLLRSRIEGEYRVDPGKLRVIPPAIDPSLLDTEPFDPGFPRPYLLFAGSGPTKGLAHALEAFGFARRDVPGLNLVVLSGEPGPEIPGVTWSKPLPTPFLAGAYLRAELVLNTSDYETFGLPVAEAAALGRPFLVSKGSGVSEWARERFPDLVVDPEDRESIAGKIKDIIGNPPSTDSLRSWADRFSPRRVVEEYLKIYREICPT